MTHLEWLKAQSGLTDEELKAWEAELGNTKFVSMLNKLQQTATDAESKLKQSEQNRINLENRIANEFEPNLRQVVSESVQAQAAKARAEAELAAARTALEKAKGYGIDLGDYGSPAEPPKAAGSPNGAPVVNPDQLTKDDLAKFSDAQARAIITVQSLSAKHQKLFGSPLEDIDGLTAEVRRQKTLGNHGYTIEQAWEDKYKVPEKRAEISAAEQKKHDDEVRAAAVKEYAEKSGSNPQLRSGVPSRFSTYKPVEASGNKQPWETDHSSRTRNMNWRQTSVSKIREAVAA